MLARCAALALVFLPALVHGSTSFAPLPGFERLRGALAVAVDPRGGAVAVGTHASVWLAKPGEPARRVLRKGEVRDLLFAPDGALWAATEQGLFELRAESERPHALGPGAGGRPTRLLRSGKWLLVGTEAGLVGGALGGPLAPLDGAAPGGLIQALTAIDSVQVFVVSDGDLFRATLSEPVDGLLRLTAVERQVLPAGDGAVVDCAELGAGTLLALRERSFAVLEPGAESFVRQAIQAPPGAVHVRVLAAAHGLWLATDAGLLHAPSPRDAFERTAAPVGGLPIADLDEHAGGLVVATERGVFRANPASREEASAAPLTRPPAAGEPSVLAVQRAALRYGGLEPSRMAELRERVRRRGRWPELELFAGWVDTQSRERDWDEAFTSGLDRTFHDRNHGDDRRLDAGVSLTWDLGDAVYHTEEIDVAHETREWIELRDEVLDEIAQLYFERRRVLLDRANERDPLTAERLRIRARELEAGLDAWTGGWWSAQRQLLASPQRPAKDPTP
jgi:hypothetical protein